MDINQVMGELDELFTQERIGEVPQFLESHIAQAKEEGADDVLLSLYNECIGFYRENGQYDLAIESCHNAVELMDKMGLEGTIPYATTLLNAATAHRAAGLLQESLELYNKVKPIYTAQLKEDDMNFASLYNNMSLLYQEMGDFRAAKEQLENALGIVSLNPNAQFEIAVTQANLANTCIELGEDDEAKQSALEAKRIFEEIGVDDAHYSAALSALGSLYYMDKDYINALNVMEKSRDCVEKYLGADNVQYKRLSENIKIITEKINEDAASVPEPANEPEPEAEPANEPELKEMLMDEAEIDKILGIDEDEDGWKSVAMPDSDNEDKKQEAKSADEHKEADKLDDGYVDIIQEMQEDSSGETKELDKANNFEETKEHEEAVKEEAVKEDVFKEEAENDSAPKAVKTFDINSAFSEIKAMASEKLRKRHEEAEKNIDNALNGINSEADFEFDALSDFENSSDADILQNIDEDKEITSMIADIMDEIAVEVEEVSENGVSGLELCRRYYEEYGRPMIAEKFRAYEASIAVGLVGNGSDCFGFDDAISKDHDYGPRFVMWVTKKTYEEIGKELQKEYEKLPTSFMGVDRIETFHGKDRAGVMVIEDFYKKILGFDLIGALAQKNETLNSVKNWLAVHDYALAAAVNGEVFRDDEGIFTSYRNRLLEYYPKAVWYRKIAQACALFSQNGQYNLPRMRKRGQLVAAELAKAECMKQAMKLYYLLNRKYSPHDKWLFKGMPDNPKMVTSDNGVINQNVRQILEKMCAIPVDSAHEKELTSLVESLAVIFANELERQNIIGKCDLYLDANTEELTLKSDAILTAVVADAPTVTALSLAIAKTEFAAFDKVQNEGGRASCQNNWPTFKVMRMSQYMTWNEDMLLQYLYEFKKNLANGRNMIEEKYARMMKSTAPKEYAAFADRLPEIPKEKQEIIERIVEMQVNWMEEFSKEYPKLAGNARFIHTEQDMPYDTSYETYLRGELGTYSDKMLDMYGRYIVENVKNGKNVARRIMENTIHFYGYKSFEEAELKAN